MLLCIQHNMLSSMGQFRISCIQYTRCLHHPPRFSVYILYCIVYHPLIIPTNYHPLHNGMTDGWLHGAPLWRELFRIILSPVLLYGVNYSELFSALWSTIHTRTPRRQLVWHYCSLRGNNDDLWATRRGVEWSDPSDFFVSFFAVYNNNYYKKYL